MPVVHSLTSWSFVTTPYVTRRQQCRAASVQSSVFVVPSRGALTIDDAPVSSSSSTLFKPSCRRNSAVHTFVIPPLSPPDSASSSFQRGFRFLSHSPLCSSIVLAEVEKEMMRRNGGNCGAITVESRNAVHRPFHSTHVIWSSSLR